MFIVKKSAAKKEIKDMPEETLENSQTLGEKIEKLKTMIDECSGSGNAKQAEKVGKLRQKLRYLEFYRDYPLGPCPKTFKCSQCIEWKYGKMRKVYRCVKCKEVLGDVVEGEFFDGSPHEVRVSFEDTCKLSFKGDHVKEWEDQERAKPEVGCMIRREFAALVRKEKEMKSKNVVRGKMLAPEHDVTQRTKNKNNLRQEKEAVQEIVAEIKAQETKEEPVKAEESKNFHGDNCKTCARMISAMGQVLPHPVNV